MGLLVLLGIGFAGLALAANPAQAAPWASPGAGNSYNMSALQAAAGTAVGTQPGGACDYWIRDTVTISAGDTLAIDAGCVLEFDNAQNLTIIGRLAVLGTLSNPVLMGSHDPNPVEGAWGSVTFEGAPFAPSLVENLTIRWSTFGLRCLGCENLTARDVVVELSASDAILVLGGARNLTFEGITQIVTTYNVQSTLHVSGASRITASAINGTGVADVLRLWNLSDASINGPVSGQGVVVAAAWIDNATNLSISGLVGTAYPTGLWITRSTGVTISGMSVWNTSVAALLATSVTRLEVRDVVLGAGGEGLVLEGCAGAFVDQMEVRGTSGEAVSVRSSDGATLSNLTLVLSGGAGVHVISSATVRLVAVAVEGGSVALLLDAAIDLRATALTADGAGTGVQVVSDASANFTGAALLNLSAAGILAGGLSNVDFWGSRIEAAPAAPSYHAADASGRATIRFFDSLADNATFAATSAGTVEVYWFVTLRVTLEGLPLAGVNVTLMSWTGASGGSGSSDVSGMVGPLLALELVQKSRARSWESPYTANAAAGPGSTAQGFGGTLEFDLNRSRTVIIELFDGSPPTLAPRPNVRLARSGLFSFQPYVLDADNVEIVSYEWSFTNGTGAQVVLAGFSAIYTFAEPGRFVVVVAAFDSRGNRGETTFEIWVNSPPFFVGVLPTAQDLVGVVDVPFSWRFAASDNDTDDVFNLTWSVDGSAPANMTDSVFSFEPASIGVYSFTVLVFDGYDRTSYRMVVLIGDPGASNRPPIFVSGARKDANVLDPYLYRVEASDPDPGDVVVIQLLAGPQGMAFLQLGNLPEGDLTWTPSLYHPRGAEAYNVSFNISLRAWDGHNFTFQNFTLILRNPPDEPPQIRGLENITLAAGETLTLDLGQFVLDADDPAGPFAWSVSNPSDTSGAAIGFDTLNASVLIIRAPPATDGIHSFFLTFRVKDSSGKEDTKVIKVEIRGPSAVEAALPWLLLLALVGGVGAAFALATRHRAGASPPSGSPGSGASQPIVPAADAPFPLFVEGVALLDDACRSVVSVVVPGVDLEDSLRLVPSKARQQTFSEGALVLESAAKRDVAMLRQGGAVLAAVGRFAGDPSPWLLDPMKGALEDVQARVAERGAGGVDQVAGDPAVAEALRVVLAVSAGSSVEAVVNYARETRIRVASIVEHVQGLVRLKIAVDNNSGQIAADVRLSVDYDERAMRLERIEPEVEKKRDKMHLGNLRPGERKTVAFYLDPLVCTRSFFNATVGWDDAGGHFHLTAMRTRAAEVVCPAFSTPRQANTAMLRRFLREELAHRDSKYFRFPQETSGGQAFKACKQAVLGQEVQLVKEFVVERPYHGEAWFYGETKVSGAPMVIWTTVYEKERVAQFSAASNISAPITGLLAELGRRFVDSRAGGRGEAPIESVAKSEATAELGPRATLLSKSQQGEIESGDR
jgi:hypothetical protein